MPTIPRAPSGGDRSIKVADTGASNMPAGLRRPTRAELTAAIEASLTAHEGTLLALAGIEREQEAKAPKAAT